MGEGGCPGTALLGKHPHLGWAVLSVWQTMQGKLGAGTAENLGHKTFKPHADS